MSKTRHGEKRKFGDDTPSSKDDKDQPILPSSPKRPRIDPTSLSGPTMQDKVEELFKKLVDAQADFSEQQDKDQLENLCKAYKNYFGPTTNKNKSKILVLGGLKSLKRTKAKYYEEHLKTVADDVYSAIEKKDDELEKLSKDLLTTLVDYENNYDAKRPAQVLPEMKTGMTPDERRVHRNPKAMQESIQMKMTLDDQEQLDIDTLCKSFNILCNEENYAAALPLIEQITHRLNNLPPTTLWATNTLKEHHQKCLVETLLVNIKDQPLSVTGYQTSLNYCQKAYQALSKLPDTNQSKRRFLAACHDFSGIALFGLGQATKESEKALDYYQQAHEKLKDFLACAEKKIDAEEKSNLEKKQNAISLAITTLGKKLLEEQHYEKAVEYFRKADGIRNDPPTTHSEFKDDIVRNQLYLSAALYKLGEQTVERKNHQAALPYFEEVYDILLNNPVPLARKSLEDIQFELAKTLNDRGIELRQKGDYQAALAHYKKAHHVLTNPPIDKNADQATLLKQKTNLANIYYNVGNCYTDVKKLEDAYESYNKAYLTQKDLPPLSEAEKKKLEAYQVRALRVLDAKGWEYLKQEHYTKALECFEEVKEQLRPLLPANDKQYNRTKLNATLALANLGKAHAKRLLLMKAFQKTAVNWILQEWISLHQCVSDTR